jgi:hypothetical protein
VMGDCEDVFGWAAEWSFVEVDLESFCRYILLAPILKVSSIQRFFKTGKRGASSYHPLS